MNAELQRVRYWRAPSLSPERAHLATALSQRRGIAGPDWSLSLGVNYTPIEEAVILAFSLDGLPGQITLARELVDALLDALALPPEAAQGDARRQGQDVLLPLLLELAVEPLLTQVEASAGCAIRLLPGRRETGRDWLRIPAAGSWKTTAAPFFLDARPDTATRLAELTAALPLQRHHFGDLPIGLRLRRFLIDLPLASLRDMAEGDVILPEQADAGEVTVLLDGRPIWRAHWQEDALGIFALADHAVDDNEDQGMQSDELHGNEEMELGLDSLPVRVSFELGRVTVPLQDLESMGPGYVFMLGHGPDHPLDILANGRKIGRGRIVEVNSALGIQVVWVATHG